MRRRPRFFGGPGGMRGGLGEEKGGVIDPPSYDLQISEGELGEGYGRI